MNERLKQLRNALEMSQNEFSEKILVGSSTLAMWELGSRKIKDIHISKICSEFNVSEEWLRNGTGPMFIENNKTILASLSNEYNLDTMDKKIVECYLNLAPQQRKAIKQYVRSLVDAILDDESYDDFREEYVAEHAGNIAARNGDNDSLEEIAELYDNTKDKD